MLRPLSSIVVPERLRRDYGDVDTLCASITRLGLIHPLTIDATGVLIAGGRRHAALTRLGWIDVPVYVKLDVNDRATALEVELEENLRRKSMSWQETCQGIAAIHALRMHNGALTGATWSQQQTGDLLEVSRASVQNALAVASLLEAGDDEIAQCENLSKAVEIVFKRNRVRLEQERAARLNRALAAQKAATMTANTAGDMSVTVEDHPPAALATAAYAPHDSMVAPQLKALDDQRLVAWGRACDMVTEADSHIRMFDMPPASFDHIYTDIPYGIDMDNLDIKAIDETAAEHDRQVNLDSFGTFLDGAWRLVKDGGFCVFWCDMEHFNTLYRLACDVGFKTQRWPLIWHKTSACKNSAPGYNFTKDYEIAMVCRKNGAVLQRPQSTSVWTGGWESGERQQYQHPFVKPYRLHEWLLKAFTSPGQHIYNPYCGEGSEVLACLRNGLAVTANDLNPTHVLRCREHIQNLLCPPSLTQISSLL